MSAPLAERVLGFMRGQKAAFVDLLRQLVEAESPSSRPDYHRRARRVLMAAISSLDYSARETQGAGPRSHIYARPRSRTRGSPLQLILGHYDTVWPVGTINKRPFSVDGNIVRGPGVFDMKGGLAQMILAIRAIKTLDLEPSVSPVIFINGDEEIGSRSSTQLIQRLAGRCERAFVLEPAMGDDGKVKTERKGIGRFTITAYGKAAHAGLDPGAGASAILELSHVIQKLFSLNDVDRGITVNVGTIDGGIQPNVIAANSSAVVDVRVPTNADGDDITSKICALQPENPEVRLRIEGGIGRPSMEATPRNERLWRLTRNTAEQLGLALQPAKVGGASDGNTTSQLTATLDGLGAVGGGAHAEHEFLYVDKTLERAALLAMLLMSPTLDVSGGAW